MMNYDELKQTLITSLGDVFSDTEQQICDDTMIAKVLKQTTLIEGQEQKISMSEDSLRILEHSPSIQKAVHTFGNEVSSKELDLDKIELFTCNADNFDCEKYPHITFHDIVVYMKYVVDRVDGVITSVNITHDFMSYFGITWDSVFAKAYANTFSCEWILYNIAAMFESDGELYALMFKNSFSNGGILFMYPDALKQIYKQFGEFYVLPSSVDELLILPASYTDKIDMLHEAVLSVNSEMPEKKKVLSSHVLYFNGKTLEVLR